MSQLGQVFKNSPNEKFLLMILCSQAKLENDNRGENVKRGLRAAAERGYRPGVAIVGYHTSYRRDHPGEVLVDKMRAPIVKLMFEKAAEGWPFRRVTSWLRSINFTTRKGTYLYLSTVQKMLTNTFYYGKFEYPVGSGAWHQGRHKPIITKELFDKAQEQFNSRKYRFRSERKSFGFTRLMKCGGCGSGVSAQEHYKKLKDGSYAKYVYYSCNHSKGLQCDNTSFLREDLLIRQLVNIIDQLSLDELGVRVLLEEEAGRVLRFHHEALGQPYGSQTQEKKDVDTKAYTKYLLAHGSHEEKRRLLCNLQSRLVLLNKAVYLEESEGVTWKEFVGHMRKCANCGSKNVSESGPYAYWKFGDAPVDDKPRVVYFSCLDCERSWKQINEGNPRLMRDYTVTPEADGAWIQTPGGSEFFLTPSFAARFRDPIQSNGKKVPPVKILGEMVFSSTENSYRVALEYEDGSEQTFDVPSLRGLKSKNPGEGMKSIVNKDGLMVYDD